MTARSLATLNLLAVLAAPSPAQPPDAWKTCVDKATAYLKSTQAADGSWSKPPVNMGVTGIVVTGLLRTGASPADEPAAKGLAFIEGLVNAKDGHVAGADPKGLINYITSVNVMALSAANRDAKYKPAIGNAVAYLKKYQWDEGEGKSPADDYFGGAGYGVPGPTGPTGRPDLSNTQFFLEALKAAGVPQEDDAFKKAAVFVSKCQNLKSEFNPAPWAAAHNDGSFVYTGANGGENRLANDTKDMGGYGSMTYAGVKSLIYCGVGKDDPRLKKAIEWIGKNYTVDANPGMPKEQAERGLYYALHTMAKAMDALGVDEFTDAKGVKHDWRADIVASLAKRQKPDGSWSNENSRWMEGDPALDTGYALMALSYCKKK